MNETFTAADAARVVAKAQTWDDALARRTEGVSWIIWGAIVPGLLMTNAWMSTLAIPMWVGLVAWIPWLALGAAATYALWRTAALTRPELPRPTLAEWAVKLAVIVALLAITHYLVQPTTMAYPLSMAGLGYVAISLFKRRLTPQGRRTGVAIGAIIVAVGLALALVGGDMPTGMMVGALTLGIVPAAGGLYLTLAG